MIKKILPIFGIFIFLFLSDSVSEMSAISVNIKSNLIILIGTLVCCMIAYPPKVFSKLFKSIHEAFSQDDKDLNDTIKQIEVLAGIRRKFDLMKLDEESRKIDNAFLKMGIEMVVDNYDRYTIFKTLERSYDNLLQEKRSETDLINTVIKLLPVFGFVGTIIGLINVLNNMGSPEIIGKGVATALLTTFYALLYANIIFLPISKKLIEKIRNDSIELALIIEGVLDIKDNVNSKAISYRLRYCIGDFYQDDQNIGTKNVIEKERVPSINMSLKKQFGK